MGSGDRIVSVTLINKRTAGNFSSATDGLFSSSLISISHLFLNLVNTVKDAKWSIINSVTAAVTVLLENR